MAIIKLDVKNPVLKNKIHYMTSDYKSRNENGKTHSGIDMIGKGYAPDDIIAIADGVVSEVGYSSTGSGYFVEIKHGDYISLYAHMKKGTIKVKKNQKIKKGTVIGYMGDTGNTTGVHLHLTIKYKNQIIDPLPFLQGKDFSSEEIKYVYNVTALNVRTGPGINYKVLNDLPNNTQVKVIEYKNGWAKIGSNSYVSNNYLTSKKPSKYYESMKVTADNLNVRYGPGTNYKKWNEKSPLPKNTVVAYVKKDGWVKISDVKNRWVSSNFLE